jgi:hypothetical protein
VRGFGGGFLAAANAGEAAGFGDGADVFAAAAGARAAAPGVAGSGFMMLTGGVDDALGNSALVGLPVAIVAGNPASGPATAATAGAFQDAA